MQDHTKPKLLFFRPKYNPDVPLFLVNHRDERSRCLSQFFNLTIIDYDCDYRQVCDAYEPVACLFEIGFQLLETRQPLVSNISTNDMVPRLAFINADAWGYTRSRIMADIQYIEFDAVFAICTTAGEHFPQLKDILYYWPNFIDESIFMRRHEVKDNLIYLTGNMREEYPWRRRIRDALLHAFPANQTPHGGYSGREAHGMPVGVSYAKMIESAWFAPSCGTMAHDLLRKHLEIPAVGTCLIAERTCVLECAGFMDMTNVVFADEHDVVEKVTYLLRNPETLHSIIENGHNLVHRRHTMRTRSQIYDWLVLHRQAALGERIVQPDPFAKLVLQHRCQTEPQTLHLEGRGNHLRILDEMLGYINAEQWSLTLPLIKTAKQIAPAMPDIAFIEAYVCLHTGNPRKTLRILVRIIKDTLNCSEKTPPDPIEWAYLIVGLLTTGRTRAAFRHARQFLNISHPELDRARAVVFLIQKSVPLTLESKNHLSIHRLPEKSLVSWMSSMANLLERYGRLSEASQLRGFPWGSADPETHLYEFLHRSGRAPRQVTPLTSGGLRLWDNPLFVSLMLRSSIHEIVNRLLTIRRLVTG